jgi:hypothetical protein
MASVFESVSKIDGETILIPSNCADGGVNRYPRTLLKLHFGELPFGYLGLGSHDLRLSHVDRELREPDENQRYRENDLYPMRGTKIPKRLRGVPMATWDFLGLSALFLWVARHAHERQSLLLTLLALMLLIGAIGGPFFILLGANGFL